MTAVAYSKTARRAVLLALTSSPRPLSQKDIGAVAGLSAWSVSVILADLRAAREVRVANWGAPDGPGRAPRLFDTRVHLPDAPDIGRDGTLPPPGVSPSIDAARRLLQGLAEGETLTAQLAAELAHLSHSRMTRALRLLLGAGEARVAGWITREATERGGRATPRYDHQLHLPNVPEPQPMTKQQRSKAARQRAKTSPARLERQRQASAERKRIRRAEERAAATPARQPFDPKTAINWRRPGDGN